MFVDWMMFCFGVLFEFCKLVFLVYVYVFDGLLKERLFEWNLIGLVCFVIVEFVLIGIVLLIWIYFMILIFVEVFVEVLFDLEILLGFGIGRVGVWLMIVVG